MSKHRVVLGIGSAVLLILLSATAVFVIGREIKKAQSLAQNCAAQLAIPPRMSARAEWEPLANGLGRWGLHIEPTRVSPAYLLVTSVAPDLAGLETPAVLASGEVERSFYSREDLSAAGFALSSRSSFAYINEAALAKLLENRYPVLYPLHGASTITQADGKFWGPNSHTKESGLFHAVDFGADIGVLVLAARAGKVVFTESRYSDLGCDDPLLALSDNRVIVLHQDGTEATYGHLRQNSIRVKEGDLVARGDVIGEVGNSGATAVPHLHFQVGGLTKSGYVTLPLSFQCGSGGHEFLPVLGPVTCEN